jgi:hypothetical protein
LFALNCCTFLPLLFFGFKLQCRFFVRSHWLETLTQTQTQKKILTYIWWKVKGEIYTKKYKMGC